MSWRLSDIRLPLEADPAELVARVARLLDLEPDRVRDLRIVRRAIDARNKARLLQVFSVEFDLDEQGEERVATAGIPRLERSAPAELPEIRVLPEARRVLVVGMGPAGLFAAWHLARAGATVTLLERGKPVEERVRDVRRFWEAGVLDPESNVQFGEGGAGTFSDGKLTTRLNHPWIRLVLETLVEFGAPAEILVQAKPHVGTDRLRLVLLNLRRHLLAQGVEIRYQTRLDGLSVHQARVAAGVTTGGEEIPCDALVLAPGHSARDTYAMLAGAGVALEAKPFAVGVRVEHPAELINRIQYGVARHPRLPAAEYALTWNDPDSGRGVYSFCMCPGGEVITASSEPGGMVVNGMSYLSRSGPWSNSALVVSVGPGDFPEPGPLGGVAFQQALERAAFRAGGGGYHAPAQNLCAFLGRGRGALHSSCRPGVREADLGRLLPPFVVQGLRRALPVFDRRMRGFISAEATLVGVESRTSAPLRIVRAKDCQSVSHAGLYPCGEGAGYAGGIMSAALDGLRTAEAIIANTHDRRSQ